MTKTLLATAAAFGLCFTLGCNQSEPGGAVGTDATFKVAPPLMATNLKPNESKQVTIDVNRKDAFKESVTLTATEVPKGLKVDDKSKTATPDVKQVSFIVSAEENAQPGDYIIKVTAKPEKTGAETITDVKVKVEKN